MLIMNAYFIYCIFNLDTMTYPPNIHLNNPNMHHNNPNIHQNFNRNPAYKNYNRGGGGGGGGVGGGMNDNMNNNMNIGVGIMNQNTRGDIFENSAAGMDITEMSYEEYLREYDR